MCLNFYKYNDTELYINYNYFIMFYFIMFSIL